MASVSDLEAEGVLLVQDGNHGEYRPRPHEFEAEGVSYIRAADMSDGLVDFSGAGRINGVARQRIRKGIGAPGDILFSHKGTVGKLARVPLDAPEFVCSPQTTFWRTLDATRLRRDYLHCFMRSHAFIEQWWVRKGETDMADYVSLTAQRQLRVAIPPLNVQHSMANPIVAMDDLIENNRRRVEVLEDMARAIYREWFVHFRFPGHEDATFVDSDFGLIPEGWCVAPFTDVASFMNGFAFKPVHLGDQGRVVIKIKQLKEGVSEGTPRSAPDAIDKKYWIEPGDLLMSWSAHLGIYWWMNEPGLLNQHLFKVTSISDYSTIYLLHALDRAMPQFWERAQGTTMRHIKRAALTEVQTLAPPRAVAEQFSGVVGPLVTSMMRLKQGADALASIRDLLLPKLVTGQIDVSDLDLDAVVERAVG